MQVISLLVVLLTGYGCVARFLCSRFRLCLVRCIVGNARLCWLVSLRLVRGCESPGFRAGWGALVDSVLYVSPVAVDGIYSLIG